MSRRPATITQAEAKAPNGTLAWLIDQYRHVDAWRSLSKATKRQRENIFKQVIKSAGRSRYADIDKATASLGAIDAQRRRPKPGIFVETMRGLFKWRLRPITSSPIRLPAYRRRKARRPAAFQSGPRPS